MTENESIDDDFNFMATLLTKGVSDNEKEIFLAVKPAAIKNFRESLINTQYTDDGDASAPCSSFADHAANTFGSLASSSSDASKAFASSASGASASSSSASASGFSENSLTSGAFCSATALSAATSFSKLSGSREPVGSCLSKCCRNKCRKCDINEDDCRCGKRSSEERLKTDAYAKDMRQWSVTRSCDVSSCNAEQKGQCLSRVTLNDVILAMEAFWGPVENLAEPTSVRKHTIAKAMATALKYGQLKVDATSGKTIAHLLFPIGKNLVCESAYRSIINHGHTNLWKECKRSLVESALAGVDEVETIISKMISVTRSITEDHFSPKRESSTIFIEYIAERFSSNSPNPDEDKLRVLPHDTFNQLWHSYESHMLLPENLSYPRAAKECFRKAWKAIKAKGTVRLTRGKGTFPTCDICNNANDMLASSKSYTKRQREIIYQYKMYHLDQQAGEREALRLMKKKAQEMNETGQPKMLCIFGDGMTEYATRVPKYGPNNNKKDKSFFANRVFGVEVYCGPIRGEILFHTDDFVQKGANFCVEVYRRTLIEVGIMLKKRGLNMPRVMHCQWDNSGENKNKEMLMYSSVLVELGRFDEITMGFLLVGHTHASIDQYFSCLRKRIRQALYIASPAAMRKLFAYALDEEEEARSVFRVPLAQIQLRVIRDYRIAFAPYWNKTIMHYQIPYNYRFFRVFLKAVAQYRQYSFPDSAPWFPALPSIPAMSHDEIVQVDVDPFVDTYSLAGQAGKNRFLAHLGVKAVKSTEDSLKCFADKEYVATMQAFTDMEPKLIALQIKAAEEQRHRSEDEARGIDYVERYEVVIQNNEESGEGFTSETDHEEEAEEGEIDLEGEDEPTAMSLKVDFKVVAKINKALLSLNDNTKGYLLFIDYYAKRTQRNKDTFVLPKHIGQVVPKIINPCKIYSDNKQAIEAAALKAVEDLMAPGEDERGEDKKTDGDSDSDDSAQLRTEIFCGRRKKTKKKKKITSNKQTGKLPSEVKHVVHAIKAVRAAAHHAVNYKLRYQLTQKVDKKHDEMTYAELFQQKLVSIEDLAFYETRLSPALTFLELSEEIEREPEFDWLPVALLSAEQLRTMENMKAEALQMAAETEEMCKKTLMHKQHNDKGETLLRPGRPMTDEEKVAMEKKKKEEREAKQQVQKQAEDEREERKKEEREVQRQKREEKKQTKKALQDLAKEQTKKKREEKKQTKEAEEALAREQIKKKREEKKQKEAVNALSKQQGKKTPAVAAENISAAEEPMRAAAVEDSTKPATRKKQPAEAVQPLVTKVKRVQKSPTNIAQKSGDRAHENLDISFEAKEPVVLAASSSGRRKSKPCAYEPEVIELCNMLVALLKTAQIAETQSGMNAKADLSSRRAKPDLKQDFIMRSVEMLDFSQYHGVFAGMLDFFEMSNPSSYVFTERSFGKSRVAFLNRFADELYDSKHLFI